MAPGYPDRDCDLLRKAEVLVTARDNHCLHGNFYPMKV